MPSESRISSISTTEVYTVFMLPVSIPTFSEELVFRAPLHSNLISLLQTINGGKILAKKQP